MISPTCGNRAVVQAMTERDLAQAVYECAQACGWLAYRTWRSDHSPKGYPDFTLCHPVRRLVLWIECKSEKGRLTQEQAEWLRALNTVYPGCAFVVRPSDWLDGTIQYILAKLGTSRGAQVSQEVP